LFVLAFALDRSETNWPLDPSFVPFLDQCLTEAQARPPMKTTFEPGEACVWTVPDAAGASEIVLYSSGREILRAAVDKGQARFQVPDQPGHYALSYVGPGRPPAAGEQRDAGAETRDEPITLLDVNPVPAESELKFAREVPLLASWTLDRPRGPVAGQFQRARLALTQPEILRQNIWWWLVLAGLAILSLETIWTTQRKPA
jgi:hypothetical protein